MFRMTLRILLAGLGALALAGSPLAHGFSVGDLIIGHPWSRPAPEGGNGAGFLKVTNNGARDDVLIAVTTPVAARAQIHETMIMGGVSMMHPRPGGLPVKAGATAEVKPGGWHIMFIDLRRTLKAGDRFPATLTFKEAGKVQVEFVVQIAPPSPAGPPKH